MTNNYRFKYILESIGQGERIYRCEVCGEDVWNMFFQIELLKQGDSKWTSHDCRNFLGHKKCLVMMQRVGGTN